jgi:hypothetical protein
MCLYLASDRDQRYPAVAVEDNTSAKTTSNEKLVRSNMKPNIARKPRSATAMWLVALPALVIILSMTVWVTAVSRSGFWADDFFNITHYNQSLGNLSYHYNQGKYVINVFWALGTLAFGLGSVVPFLILNTLVFATGVVIWLWTGTRGRWGITEAWWIGGLFVATAAWFPTALWSSNIVHSVAFLALGLGLLAHDRCIKAQTVRDGMLWSLAGGAAWTLAVISDLLYLGLLVIAAYCAFHQLLKIRQLGASTIRTGLAVGSWNLLIPAVYFVGIAYPATTASSAYATNGFQFIRQNLHFYRETLAPTGLLEAAYIIALILGIVGGVLSIRRRDWFPLVILSAAGAIALGALIQGQQRDIHYAAMPLLLTFSAVAAGAHPLLFGRSTRVPQLRGALFLAAILALFLFFRQGAKVRSYFVQSPFGDVYGLTTFRSQVATLTPEGGIICADLALNAQYQTLLVTTMSGEDGFLVPPISAARAYLVPAGEPCPASTGVTHITVGLDARGDFVASG